MTAESASEYAVLGIDAAWTAHNPSGVALIVRVKRRWLCRALAPSYQKFISIGCPGNRSAESQGRKQLSEVLCAAQTLCADMPIRAVGVDMPLSLKPIVARRVADNQISSRFNKAKCPTHSPSPERPGRRSVDLREVFVEGHFSLATKGTGASLPALFEAYPHAALLGLLGESERIKYKVGKSVKLWPTASIQERKALLLTQLKRIRDRLAREIEGIDLNLPESSDDIVSIASLKPIEDQLDALVCAWVAIQFVEGATVPFGDKDAAIWIPKLSLEAIDKCDSI